MQSGGNVQENGVETEMESGGQKQRKQRKHRKQRKVEEHHSQVR